FPPANNNDPQVALASQAMSREIQTQLSACNYALECRRAIEDRVILGTGILKGPVNTGRPRTKYVKSGTSWLPQVVYDYEPTITSVRPWRFYPDMDVTDFKDSKDTVEYHPKTAMELSLLRSHPGFDAAAIEAILDKEANVSPS